MGRHCDLLGILWVVQSVVVFEDAGESIVVFKNVVVLTPRQMQTLFPMEFRGFWEWVLTPRGRYTVELHFSFLRLQGQANDFS
jgi:hypothetical protein